MATIEDMRAYAARQDTPTLIDAMLRVDRESKPDASHRLTGAVLADTLTDRYPEADERMERIYADESDAGLAFVESSTYAEILAVVLDELGVATP